MLICGDVVGLGLDEMKWDEMLRWEMDCGRRRGGEGASATLMFALESRGFSGDLTYADSRASSVHLLALSSRFRFRAP